MTAIDTLIFVASFIAAYAILFMAFYLLRKLMFPFVEKNDIATEEAKRYKMRGQLIRMSN